MEIIWTIFISPSWNITTSKNLQKYSALLCWTTLSILLFLKGMVNISVLKLKLCFLNFFIIKIGIVFLAKKGKKIVGVMRMNSCVGKKWKGKSEEPRDEINTDARKSVWLAEWAIRDPKKQHWHLGPIGVVPSHRRSGFGSTLMERFKQQTISTPLAYLPER